MACAVEGARKVVKAFHGKAAAGRHIDTILKAAKLFDVPVTVITRIIS